MKHKKFILIFIFLVGFLFISLDTHVKAEVQQPYTTYSTITREYHFEPNWWQRIAGMVSVDTTHIYFNDYYQATEYADQLANTTDQDIYAYGTSVFIGAIGLIPKVAAIPGAAPALFAAATLIGGYTLLDSLEKDMIANNIKDAAKMYNHAGRVHIKITFAYNWLKPMYSVEYWDGQSISTSDSFGGDLVNAFYTMEQQSIAPSISTYSINKNTITIKVTNNDSVSGSFIIVGPGKQYQSDVIQPGGYTFMTFSGLNPSTRYTFKAQIFSEPKFIYSIDSSGNTFMDHFSNITTTYIRTNNGDIPIQPYSKIYDYNV